MSKYTIKYSADSLLEHLESKGLITGEDLSDFVIGQQQETELPLYLRALIVVGAFIACLCFLGFLESFDIAYFNIIGGLAFVAGAIGLQRVAGHDNTVKHFFLVQSSLSSMIIGKVLLVYGIGDVSYSMWDITLGLLIITGFTYHIYRMPIDRFLSSFATLLSILVNIWSAYDLRELLFNLFFLLQLAGVAILLTHGKITRDYIPLSYAFAFSLCASVLFLVIGDWEREEQIYPAFINMLLTGGLIALFGWVAGGIEKLKTEPLVLASVGAVLLGLISAPGILLTIGLMVVGYAKHEKLLIIVGALLMPIFLLLYYYYGLDIPPLQRSGILIGSGIVLLAARFYLKHKGWDEGGSSCAQKQ